MRKRWLVIAAAVLALAGLLCLGLHSGTQLPAGNDVNTAELGLMLLEDAGEVSVLAVRDGSLAEKADVRPGDVLLRVNQAPIAAVEDLETLLAACTERELQLHILRAEETLVLNILLEGARQ